MNSERACEHVRVDISARLDGEIDEAAQTALEEHLESCSACRRYEAELSRVRSALRLQVIDVPAPDVTSRVLARVRAEGGRQRRRDLWTGRFRVAAVAAAVSALVFIGASLPFSDRPPQTASASEISKEIRAAARTVRAYRAGFTIVERGWHRSVPVRRFSATLAFDSPERLKLSVRDLTLYPDPTSWPANDVDLVTDEEGWWIREPSTCPARSLPGCPATQQTVEQRSVVGRQPFDGTTALPTDIVLPLETVAGAEGLEVIGRETVLDRETYRIRLPYRHAVPLVAALQPGGSWRAFHPFDVVDVWIDAETWFPLRYEVSTTRTSDRSLWAQRLGYDDEPGSTLLAVEATTFEESGSLAGSLFDPPEAGIVTGGGFEGRDFVTMASRWAPDEVAGLRPYRSGITSSGQRILAYSDGMTWLKITRDQAGPSQMTYTAEEVKLEDGGIGYYRPATDTFKRSLDIYVGGGHQQVESNLPRAGLLKVAASLPGAGRRLPAVLRSSGGLRLHRLDIDNAAHAVSFALEPTYLPPGYELRAALLSRARSGGSTLTSHYRGSEAEFDGFGIRIAQARPAAFLPPTGADYLTVAIGDEVGRWSPERGELEWIADGVYRAVAAPSFDLGVALAIAEGLR